MSDEIAESLGLEAARGAMVASVTPGGPAEEAEIKAGDIILKFNGEEVPEMRDLPRIVAETDIGSEVEVTLWRNDEEVTTKVKVGELEKAEEEGKLATGPREVEGAGTEIEAVGLTLKALTPSLRDEFDVPGTVDGVMISAVKPLSEAAEKRLGPGDVIVEINQQPVDRPETMQEILDKAQSNDRSSILLLINRGGDVRFVALRLGE